MVTCSTENPANFWSDSRLLGFGRDAYGHSRYPELQAPNRLGMQDPKQP